MPVSVIQADRVVAQASNVLVDGTNSYDSGNLPLTYDWRIVSQPSGSDITLWGMVRATRAIGEVAVVAAKKGYSGNGQQIEIVDTSSPQLILSVNSGVVRVVVRNEGPAASEKTTYAELVDAINNRLNPAYSGAVAQLVTAELIGDGDLVVTTTAAVALAGGSDSTEDRPYFFPEVSGTYRIGLIVSNGVTASTLTDVMISVVESNMLVGTTPNADFMWMHLSDFWKLVDGKRKFEVFWRSAMQVVGSEMLRVWQADNAKSIRDIQEWESHRWVGISALRAAGASVTSAAPKDGAAIPISSGGDTSKAYHTTADLNGLVAGQAIAIAYQSLPRVGVVLKATRLKVHATMTLANPTQITSATTLTGNAIAKGDPVLIFSGPNIIEATVDKLLTSTSLQLTSKVVLAAGNYTIQIGGVILLDEAVFPNQSSVRVMSRPYAVATTDGSILAGDSVVISREASGVLETKSGTVLAADKEYLVLDVEAEEAGWSIQGVYLTQTIRLWDTTKSVPRIQENALAPDDALQDAIDYFLEGTVLTFREALGVDGAIQANTKTFTSASTDFSELSGRAIYIYPMTGFSGGIYPIASGEDGEAVLESAVLTTLSNARFSVLRWHPDVLPPDRWWAETVYLDNAETIENNFGLLVGLTRDAAEGLASGYLPAVRALWFALWSGPTIANIRMGTQVFFGLPVSMYSGTVSTIEDDYSEAHGRIVVEDNAEPFAQRAYLYPKAVGIAVNPETGVPYVNGDHVPAYVALSRGVEVKDYVNAPTWYKGLLTGADELRKFHTFKVEVDLSVVPDASGFELVKTFVDRVKPAYTDYWLVGLRVLTEEITVTATESGVITYDVADEVYVTPDAGVNPNSVTGAPPFKFGATHGLDQYRGDGNVGTGQFAWPMGGESPLAVITFTQVGVPVPPEDLKLSGKFVGKLRQLFGVNQAVVNLVGGSIPQVNDVLVGRTTGAQLTVTAVSFPTWPEAAYINRHRSDVWIPLVPESVLGPSYTTITSRTVSGYVAGPPTLITLNGTGVSTEDDTYVNYRLKIGSEHIRITAYDGGTRQATLASAYAASPANGTAYTIHPPRSVSKLLGVDFFREGSTITTAGGKTAVVTYFGPSYLRVRDTSVNPYQTFVRGEILTGANGETATLVNGPYFVTPDIINTLDRPDRVGPATHTDYRVCFYVSPDGDGPALDSGLILDDVELFQYPYDPDTAIAVQTVPSHGPGLYWWLDRKLVYNTQDVNPIGPGPEPVWQPSPDVLSTLTQADPGWNPNVLWDTGICRAVSCDPDEPPGPASRFLPDPIIASML